MKIKLSAGQLPFLCLMCVSSRDAFKKMLVYACVTRRVHNLNQIAVYLILPVFHLFFATNCYLILLILSVLDKLNRFYCKNTIFLCASIRASMTYVRLFMTT